MPERDPGEVPAGTHCEWCGAEFERDTPPARRTVPAAAPPPAAPAAVGEPPTHCEWCGAEYPVPDED